MLYHCGLREGLRKDPPSDKIRNMVLLRAESVFDPLYWEIPADFCSYSHYLRVLDKLDMSSSPGYPYMRRSPTNAILFRVDENGVKSEESVNYVWQVVRQRLDGFTEADPIRLFVKQEPHKLIKIEQGRYRLISSVSVVDQIIDHMLFDEMNDKIVKSWLENPIKIGWSSLNGGWKAFPPGKRFAIDKSSWDWTVQMWILELCLAIRLRLCKTTGPLLDNWVAIAKYRYMQLYGNPLFITSGGLLLRQLQEGVQKSGCVNTLADNSIAQWILHCRVCIERNVEPNDFDLWAMGDDTSQSLVEPGYLDWLGEFCIVKECQQAREFCGMRFNGINVEPLYKGKHAFNLLHLNPAYEADVANSYTLLYHRSCHRDWMRSLFESMGLKIFPLWYCDAIYDGYE
nr:hypothetical protein [Leuven Sobemo-like virus 3]